jgi:hypothetical protein
MMADIDTSTYPKATNRSPLETMSGVANLQNVMNQNRLFQQEFNSKLGLSRIYKEAIDPATGQLDVNKLRGMMSDPNVTLGLPQAYQNSQEAQQRNIGIDTSQLENQQKHWQAVGSFMAPLVAPGAKPTSQDVLHQLAAANAAGLADQNEMAKVWSTLPRTQDGRVDESKVPAWSQQMMLNLMSRQEQLNAVSPAPTMVNNGQAQIPMRLPQFGAPSQAGPGIQNELPPTTQRYNPATRQMEFVGAGGGMGGGSAPPMAGGGHGGAPGGGGMAAAPPLGAPEAASVDASFGAKQGTELQSMADNVPARKALLGNLEGALGQFTSGPGQNWKMVAKAFANANSPFGNVFDAKSIASQEEFNKQAVQLAQQQFQALGGTGTDSKLDSAMHTSPNDALSKLGNKGIIAMLKGNEDAISAKNQAWQAFKQQNGPQSYGQFSVQFNKSYDPRVFQSQYLTQDDNKKMLSGMTKQEQKSFLNSYRTSLANGWVKLPGGQ